MIEILRPKVDQYVYCILPGGSRLQFPVIDAELVVRKVEGVQFCTTIGRGRIYRVPKSELHKLHNTGPFSELYAVPNIERLREDWDATDWKDVSIDTALKR